MPSGGGSYEIRIKGRLSDTLLTGFEGLTATVQPVETVLYGPVPDQSALHGVLVRISRWAWNWSRSGGSPITRRACGRIRAASRPCGPLHDASGWDSP